MIEDLYLVLIECMLVRLAITETLNMAILVKRVFMKEECYLSIKSMVSLIL